jgi:hypothetical protein
MLFCCNRYLYRFLHKPVFFVGLILIFTTAAYSQNQLKKETGNHRLNPLLLAPFKKTNKAYPLLSGYIKPTKHELMYWPNYPLSAAQIDARDKEWDRKNKQPFGEQIASDIIKSYVNSLIYGKKSPVTVAPKF